MCKMPSIKVYERQAFDIQFSPFLSKYLACATSKNHGLKGAGFLLILENDYSEQLKVVKSSPWPCGLLSVHWLKANENLLVSSSCDGSVQLWQLFGSNASAPLTVYREHHGDVVSIDSNSNFIATGSWDCTVKIWDLQSHSSLNTFHVGPEMLHSVKWSPSFRNLLSIVSDSHHLTLWDKSLPLPSVHRIPSQNSQALDCDWSLWQPYEIAISGSDGALRLWDIRNLRNPFSTMSATDKPVGRVKWSPHHPGIIATASYDLSIGIWDIFRRELLEAVRHRSAYACGLDFNKTTVYEIGDCGLDSFIHVYSLRSLFELSHKMPIKNKL